MLGQPGSTPLDLFWDVVEEEERALRSTRNDVLDVLDVRILHPELPFIMLTIFRTSDSKLRRRPRLRSS
jgi:hypothetical protein